MDEAERCDRLLLMREGRLIADDTPDGAPRAHRTDDIEGAFLALVERRGGARHDAPGSPLAVAARVLTQLRRDHRTLAMLLVLPCLLMTLLWWMFQDIARRRLRPRSARPLLALFPFIVMFLVTSVTTLRERSSGTLERLLAMPMGKLDFLVGYALAFGAGRRGAVRCSPSRCQRRAARASTSPGPVWLLGRGRGGRRRARHGARAVRLAPSRRPSSRPCSSCRSCVIPQILLCGLFVAARRSCPPVLEAISDVLPLSYAVDAMTAVTTTTSDALGGVDGRSGATSRIVVGFARGRPGPRRGDPAPAYP